MSPNSFKQKTSREEKRPASVHLLCFPAHLFLLILHFGQLTCLVYKVLFFCLRGCLYPLWLLWHSHSMWQQLGGRHSNSRIPTFVMIFWAFLIVSSQFMLSSGGKRERNRIPFSWISDIPKWKVKNKQGFLVHAVIYEKEMVLQENHTLLYFCIAC